MADHIPALYAFCGAFFAELKALGIEDVVISPGSRSTPLVVSADRADLELHVHLDERSAGFFALGLAKASRRPVGLICTSGTAAANYLPAIVEANHSGVPLLVLTADRPPEQRGWGANQTIDQTRLYGTNVRRFVEMPVASESDPAVAQRHAREARELASGSPRGPVHLNWPLRKPLEPDESVALHFTAPSPPRPVDEVMASDEGGLETIADVVAEYQRGVIVAGPMDPGTIDPADVLEVARRAGWPVLAESTSQLRSVPNEGGVVVATAGHLLRVDGFAATHRPDAVLRVGGSPTATVMRRWLEEVSPQRSMLVTDGAAWSRAAFEATDIVRFPPGPAFGRLAEILSPAQGREVWQAAWRRADATVSDLIGASADVGPFGEPGVVRALARGLPGGSSLYVSNSMPVRDLDLFWPAGGKPVDIYSNRGASGIDGLVSSALGVAANGEGPVVLLTGDLAFLHDTGGLLSASRLGLPLVTVVVNNDGGGIFSLLPIADLGDSVRFRELFHTPHGVDIGALSRGAGIPHRNPATQEEFDAVLAESLAAPGPSVIEVEVDAAAEVARHRALGDKVRSALSSPP
jgi:2-succinyl-5-enolpyruvyl-6-hydroxy-3-cyclohexene-1-carboxylate synthase